LDDLRKTIPYAHGGNVRKLSKIATLLLAKNHIIMQVEEIINDFSRNNLIIKANAIVELKDTLKEYQKRIDELEAKIEKEQK
jgi:hypothetical protein